MRLLVTGGAGFIGSNFVHYILREHPDWEVSNLDKLTYAGLIIIPMVCRSLSLAALITMVPSSFRKSLSPLVITNALEGKEIPIYGDGLNVRDWIYVEDHCRALDLVIQQGKPRSLITFVADRPGHDRRYALETSRIERELGWRPAIPLEEGLEGTVQWHIQNEPWWRRIKSGEYAEYYERMCSQR